MNPWWLTFGLFAFGTVMLMIGFGKGHAMAYEAGLADGKMKMVAALKRAIDEWETWMEDVRDGEGTQPCEDDWTVLEEHKLILAEAKAEEPE